MHYTEILVARHGETDWNRSGKWQGKSDIPLNSKGMEQARELAAKLAKEDIRHIYSSDLARARATAEIVKKALASFGVYTDPRFRERNFGKFEGRTSEQVAKYMGLSQDKVYMLEYDELMVNDLSTVEKWDDVRKRVWEALYDLAETRSGSKSLVVAHGGIMRAVTTKMGNGGEPRLIFNNADFIRLRFEDNAFQLIED